MNEADKSTVEREYYSIAEAATIFGQSAKTIIRWIRDGKLRAIRTGLNAQSEWLVPVEAIAETKTLFAEYAKQALNQSFTFPKKKDE